MNTPETAETTPETTPAVATFRTRAVAATAVAKPYAVGAAIATLAAAAINLAEARGWLPGAAERARARADKWAARARRFDATTPVDAPTPADATAPEAPAPEAPTE